jgi:hypothetical protein
MTEHPTFLKELREAARTCVNVDLRRWLRDAADEIEGNLIALLNNPTDENLRTLNGNWSHAVRILGIYKNPHGKVTDPFEVPILVFPPCR